MKVQKPVFGEITQGTLFNCAIADRYGAKRVHGLAITARCDIANDKFPVLNYLPVVTLMDWMHCDGFEILFANALKSQRGNFDGILKQAEVAVSLLAAVSRQKVVSSFFFGEDVTKKRQKLASKVREKANSLDRLETLDTDDTKDRNWFLDTYGKEASALVKELVQHKVPSFYFLPSVTDENENDGHVILLRECAFLPRRIARDVANGVDRPMASGSDLESHLSFQFDNFAMPVGQIPSPDIEHIMQTYSYMFGRIGLENYAADFISNVCARKFVLEETA